MILIKDQLSYRESKSSDHRINYQLKYNCPTSRSPFSIHHNDSTDSYTHQTFVLSSKNKQNITKTGFPIRKSYKSKQLKFKSPRQFQQFQQYNKPKLQCIQLRTISYQETNQNNQQNQNQMVKGQITRNELFSRQNIQQNNKKLNLLRKQNSKKISPTKTMTSPILKQQQRLKTVFNNSPGASPAFKITSSSAQKFYKNDQKMITATALQKLKETQKDFNTLIQNFNKQKNLLQNQNQTKIKFKSKNQISQNQDQNQPHQNIKLNTEVDDQLLNSEEYIMSKAFMENQITQNNWQILKPVKIQTYRNHKNLKIKTSKKQKSSKNRKSVPIFLGIYKQEKRQLTNQTQPKIQLQQDMIKSSQQNKFRPKLKMKKNDDNMNILATILRKKSNIMSKQQLLEYLHKIIS